jgi:putative transposase
MGRKRYTPEQIIRLLRQSEVLSSEGRNLSEICREIGVTTNTYYRSIYNFLHSIIMLLVE